MMFLRVQAYRVLIRVAAWCRMRGYMPAYWRVMGAAMYVLFGYRSR